MNPSTALARTLVDELVRNGVTDAVLSPGSRSAPLAFALHDSPLRLHVRIDERSAGFLALGLAKASGRPVPVVTTSGTAAANLHPAVIEASHAAVPLLVLTADRPPELRGTGSNQTIDQLKLYGDIVRLFVEVGAPVGEEFGYWRSLTCRAVSAALGDLGTRPGPVHLNVALRDPLVPSPGSLAPGRGEGKPWTVRVLLPTGSVVDDLPDRTVVVLGDGADSVAAQALASARGFPTVAEPSSGVVGTVPEMVLGVPGWLDAHRPDRVLVLGRPTLSRAVGALLRSAPCDVVASAGVWADSGRMAARVLPAVPGAGSVNPDPALINGTAVATFNAEGGNAGSVDHWADQWEEAGVRARAAVLRVLGDGLSEPAVAIDVMAAAQGLLVVGSSKPVRDLFLAGGREGVRVLANRGAAGIDGMVSTAVGAALAHGAPTLALLGDLTFLHDSNGLVIGPDEPRPDLTIVVVNNDGGAIFGLLEQGAPEYAEPFERLFGTPHGVDLAALCAATGTPHVLAASRKELRDALVGRGIRVVEVKTDRLSAIELDGQLRAAVTAALG